MLTTDVAPGVHRLAHAYVNCYLVEGDDGRLTIVDTGLPDTWPLLGHAVRALGRRPDDVAAVVLTHAHFDHTGSAAAAQRRLGVPIWVHPEDATLAAHPYRYLHERPRAAYPVRHPLGLVPLTAMLAAGAWRVRGVTGTTPIRPDEALPVPGGPRVVLSPGHTLGHVALHLPDRDALISGDALVTLDPYTYGRGPQIVAGAATADSAQALASLDALAATGAGVVLPGHGDPWTEGIASAVEHARRVGPH
ncbi:MBL fold metallo-hydrolase [Cellulomonas shaoxiangyii]|uniref:MBL fold metallo-hydrolase n=1 Tax=Cellulomonas shaoxiangyii TaxID=2566013 RepID=A0A4P7SH18_9CELL|nr:MBL fold metallo-hydrolase [Cellulomonas shaoxiangyii]QCB93479.1 MBL fold metallo-hydrolase [Cellulomonas shaoxiangyii]TGY86801.1 MBL fold metallo-hydrolase [Cellulomonas shaoxiangyii]